MLYLGIDTVDVERFSTYHTKPRHLLERIFSPTEIDYALSAPAKGAERFAARFAAKEAFFKALSQIIPSQKIYLRPLLPHIGVANHPAGFVYLQINWPVIQQHISVPDTYTSRLSLTHTKQSATAVVILLDQSNFLIDKPK